MPESAIPEVLRIDTDLVLPILERFLDVEMRRTGRRDAVIGLSGGVDSAVSAALAVRALGREHTHLVQMPHAVSSASSKRDAAATAEALGVPIRTVEITGMTAGYPDFESMDRRRAGNLMARMRMAVLYDVSASVSGLVIGTSNKTELLLGYGTQHGDMASAINPVGDLYKTQLRQLAPVLGVPEAVCRKAPTADLWEGQTDEGELGIAYVEADRILYRLFDERCSPEVVVALGSDRDLVDRLLERVRTSEFKRHLPIICKVSERTVGVDWLYPRDWGT